MSFGLVLLFTYQLKSEIKMEELANFYLCENLKEELKITKNTMSRQEIIKEIYRLEKEIQKNENEN